MVTLQILVLSFLVRIQVAQLKREQHNVVLFFCWATRSYIYNPSKPPFDKGGLWQCSALLAVGKIQNIYPTYRLYCLLVEPI